MSFTIAGVAFFGGIAAVIARWRKKHAKEKGGIVLTSAQKAAGLLLGKLPDGKAVEKAIEKIEKALDDTTEKQRPTHDAGPRTNPDSGQF